jgi:hypothetical protein
MVTRKPDHQGELEISRNTIVQGMPEWSGEPVVTTFVWFFLPTRHYGRAVRPAFPAPSDFRGTIMAKTRVRECRGNARASAPSFSTRSCRSMDSGLASSMRPGMTKKRGRAIASRNDGILTRPGGRGRRGFAARESARRACHRLPAGCRGVLRRSPRHSLPSQARRRAKLRSAN